MHHMDRHLNEFCRAQRKIVTTFMWILLSTEREHRAKWDSPMLDRRPPCQLIVRASKCLNGTPSRLCPRNKSDDKLQSSKMREHSHGGAKIVCILGGSNKICPHTWGCIHYSFLSIGIIVCTACWRVIINIKLCSSFSGDVQE